MIAGASRKIDFLFCIVLPLCIYTPGGGSRTHIRGMHFIAIFKPELNSLVLQSIEFHIDPIRLFYIHAFNTRRIEMINEVTCININAVFEKNQMHSNISF